MSTIRMYEGAETVFIVGAVGGGQATELQVYSNVAHALKRREEVLEHTLGYNGDLDDEDEIEAYLESISPEHSLVYREEVVRK